MSALLLDTHAWIWLAAGDPRVAKHERILNRAAVAGELLLPAIAVYEAALVGSETEQGRRRGKQAVRMLPTVQQWLRDAMSRTRVVPLALEAAVAMDGALLHGLHPDPFDRLIVATASSTSARLVTADAKIIAFARAVGVARLEL